jgi:hypothetical protein
MGDNNFSGKWVGQYIYGENYPDGVKDMAVEFTIEMVANAGIVKGTCIDEQSKHLFEKPATIEGTIRNNVITFVKRYPHYWDIDENKRITQTPELPSQEIHYTGKFENNTFLGEWERMVMCANDKGDVYESISSGKWIMKRKK